ncbi:unnamed protein product [Blepharisma stoltei]|uniref:Uncharacterized protein n=1 Tax=Blepharisma stoltei TaxID=1481888 RepID=A0AAU9JMR6_9CILI|nr:unnamed protein product [Blepharisma stoltei]
MEPCNHYERGCDLLSACCNEFFACRYCHDKEKYEDEKDFSKKHKMIRSDVTTVRCRACQATQGLNQYCINCNTCMGAYFCAICHLYDSDLSKNIYHCDKCGICRVGPREKYFHCDTCEACLSVSLRNSHTCRPGILKSNCAVCQEDMFTSRQRAMPMSCGHFIHNACLRDMMAHHRYTCPICCKSIADFSDFYQKIDEEVSNTPMPEEYQNIDCNILCNDCLKRNRVRFHVIGMKCPDCGSYNTTRY